MTTKTLVGYAGMTVGGWLGWWLGDLVGIVTAVVLSGVFSGVGLYAARKWAEYYLE